MEAYKLYDEISEELTRRYDVFIDAVMIDDEGTAYLGAMQSNGEVEFVRDEETGRKILAPKDWPEMVEE